MSRQSALAYSRGFSSPDLGATDISWNASSPSGSATSPARNRKNRIEAPVRFGETIHQTLQRSLHDRRAGGPNEHIQSHPQRLRNTRNCEIIHSNMEEGLTHYKSLEPIRPHQPNHHRRYHLNHGIRVKDQDTVVVDACDIHYKTKKGLLRDSSGTVTYSETHRRRVELDVIDLARILDGGIPGGGHAWTPRKLERIFRERTGRPGTWAHYEVSMIQFLQLFPKTFELFGPDHQSVRLKHHVTTAVLDVSEDAMRRLACARKRGHIEAHPVVEGTIRVHCEDIDELFRETGNLEADHSPKMEEMLRSFECGGSKMLALKEKLRSKTPDSLTELVEHRMKVAFKARPQSSIN